MSSTSRCRRSALVLFAATAVTLIAATGPSDAQQAGQLVGTWIVVKSDTVMPNGSRSPTFGTNPRGVATFDSGGRYSLQIIRDNPTKFASNNRLEGTPEENKAAVHAMISHFGTYTVTGDTILFKLDASSYPNWSGTEQKRPFKLNGDELSWQTPAASGGGSAELLWRRAK
jgi:hypothetical protein